MLDKLDIFTLKDKEYIVLAKENLLDKNYYYLVEVDEEENLKKNIEIVYEFEDGLLIEDNEEIYNKVKDILEASITTEYILGSEEE